MMKKIFTLLFLAALSLGLYAQKQVSGVVVYDNGEPVIGASIQAKGTTLGTISDYDGKFEMEVPESVKTLVVSYVGMATQEVPAGKNLKITMQENSEVIQEVVVTGYGNVSKGGFAGSVETVKAEDIEKKNPSDITKALAGESAGVQVVTTSGQPGTVADIRIRGIGSISASSSPLYVVDGIPLDAGSISSIDPGDIASTTILKDATATSLYGSRGANGVIVITTKKGSSNGDEGKIEIDVKAGANMRLLPMYDVVDSPEDFVTLAWQSLYTQQRTIAGRQENAAISYANKNLFGSNGIPTIYNLWDKSGNLLIDAYDAAGNVNPSFASDAQRLAQFQNMTSWYNTLFSNGLKLEATAKISGGNEKLNYYTSFGYLKDEGYYTASDFQRFNARANVNYQPKKWLKGGLNIQYSYAAISNPGQGREKMKELMQKQQQIQDEWNKLQQEQEKLADFMKENEIANEDLLKKQEQINKLFEEVIPEEMRKMMEQIDKLLEEMPREQMQQMMQDIKKNNQSMQELLDRNLSLLEQLKMEKDLNDLANKLDKLGEELQKQNAENQDKEAGEECDQKTAEEAKEEFDKMMEELDQLLEKNQELQQPFDVEKDQEMQESIDQELQDAMQNEQGGEQQQSQQNKQNAGQKMQQMAQNMMSMMQMGGMQQMAEDARLVRTLLENVVHASHEQEALMTEIGSMRSDDPSLTDKIIHQKEVADNFNMVRDSLRNMAQRQPMIQNYIFDELHTIENQTSNAMKHLNNLKLSQALRHQQTAMMSMNNLALMLAESLENMESSMESMGMPMQSCQSKPGKQGQQSMKNMQQMQQQLSEQLKKMQQQMEQGQQTPNSMSEEFARMAAEQEMLRQGMQQMLNDMKENGQIGDDGLNEIIKDMEKLEEELVNKKINRQMIEMSRKIESRMLESQKAQEKREQEEKRKSNEFKGTHFDRNIDEILYKESLKKNQEFLRTNPIEFAPYYKEKINEYYLKKNTQ